MKISLYDLVQLSDGSTGVVTDVFVNPEEAYMIEITGAENKEFDEAVPIVGRNEIVKVIKKHKKTKVAA